MARGVWMCWCVLRRKQVGWEEKGLDTNLPESSRGEKGRQGKDTLEGGCFAGVERRSSKPKTRAEPWRGVIP